jgi:hypothetical protein
MPYIKNNARKRLDSYIEGLINQEPSIGELNYIVSRLVWTIWARNRSYTLANNLIGMLECAKSEFYRRYLAPYEDTKIKENGDVKIK